MQRLTTRLCEPVLIVLAFVVCSYKRDDASVTLRCCRR